VPNSPSTSPENIIKRVSTVASLPQIFMKVEETLNNPASSSMHLAKVIEEDPALTGRLLRLANSAYYGFSAKIESVNHAITAMGTQQLRELVLACSVLKLFKDIPEELVNMELFWRHSIACGVVARAIAHLRFESNIERYFVAGLLHDVGRLILFMQKPNVMLNMIQLAQQKQQLLYRVENEVLGFNHAKLGGLLMASWKLSPRLIESISWHHAPTMAKQFPIDAAIIHTADIIANALELGNSGEKMVPNLKPAAWDSLGLEINALEKIISILDQQYQHGVRFILGEEE